MSIKTKEIYSIPLSAFYSKKTKILLWLWRLLKIDYTFETVDYNPYNQITTQMRTQNHRGIYYILSVKEIRRK